MQNIYIKELFRYIVNKLQEEINTNYNEYVNLSFALMMVLSVVLLVVYITLWLPLIKTQSTDVIIYFNQLVLPN